MHDFNGGFAAGDSDLVAGRMAQMAEVRRPRTTDSAGFGLARNSLDPSAANQLKPAGFFERLGKNQSHNLGLADQLQDRLAALAERIGAPLHGPESAVKSGLAGAVPAEPGDAVTCAIADSRRISERLDFLLGLAGRIAERL